MRKLIFIIPPLLLVFQFAVAQTGASSNTQLKDEQQKFIRHLKNVSIDSVTVYPLARHFDAEVNKIYNTIMSDQALDNLEKEKAVRSLVYFMGQLSTGTGQHKFDVYDIPGALEAYSNVLDAIIHHKPFTDLLTPLRASRTSMLAAAFSQYEEHKAIDEIAVYKRVLASPEYIFQFLEVRPDFRFADSLIVEAAAYNPAKFVSYFIDGQPAVQQRMRNSRNIYVKRIISLSYDRNATELYPFVIQIAEGRMDPQEILATRSDVTQYFQLLVNTLKESRVSKDSSSVFLKVLRNGIRQKALSFYTNLVNERHNSPDAVRFAAVKKLRPEDYYYVLTSSGDELYTSSYIGLYKRLMEQFKDNTVDSLFDIVHYDNFSTFVRLAANYNVAVDFLHRLSVEGMEQCLHRFMGRIERNPNNALDKAMDIGDFFSGIDSSIDINDLVSTELKSNLSRCSADHQYLGMKLYSTLIQVFELVKERKGMDKLWSLLGNYEVLKKTALENKNKEIVELVLFYGDEDGKSSFGSFMRSYTDTSTWKITRTPNWVGIRSTTENPIVIYANMPLDGEEEMDLRAQDTLIDFIKQQSHEPAIIVHRGHSYHLDKTLKRLTPSVKLAVLGSCGGYNQAISIASISPDVQVIGSKKTGAKSINDPLINIINTSLIQETDLVWSDIWAKLSAQFRKDPVSATMFSEYFSPDNNLSLFVLKLFNL